MAATYRLKRGKHQQTINGRTVVYSALDPAGNARPGFSKGDEYVSSDQDLVDLFGPQKFERVPDDQVPSAISSPEQPEAAAVNNLEGLGTLTVAELRTLADEEEIDLDGAKLKGDIISVLEEAGISASL
jgi:hypothetical protein